MKRITLSCNGYLGRWAGGSFIAVWKAERADENVPDLMVDLPESLNRSKATKDDIQRILKEAVS